MTIESPDHYMDDWFARAAKHTIVSVDEVVETSHFADPTVARRVFWERNCTQAVVHQPGELTPVPATLCTDSTSRTIESMENSSQRVATPLGQTLSWVSRRKTINQR